MDQLITIKNPKSPISESYRGVRTSIEFSNLDKDIKVINVTSSKQNEGKSTVIGNLAVTFANLDKKVLVIDGDLRNPTVHKVFNVSNAQGITDILRNNKVFADCVHITKTKNLHVLSCGTIPPNPSEILASKRMSEFVGKLREEYDYIFIDAPPIGIVTDAGVMNRFVDGTIFVVGSGEADTTIVSLAKERLEIVNSNVLGVILNKFNTKSEKYGYYSYYYEGNESGSRSARHRKKKK